ncbi:MAG: rRNA maturation RNase YbeY [Woeseiaceae bacterium]|nr:rRNA maturation RNase YbeY [Woeseiaceae bacterium]
MAAVAVDIQVACEDDGIPSADIISSWVTAAVDAACGADAVEVSVRVVGRDEIRTLNRLYRDKDSPTNVLSFPAGDIAGMPAAAPRSLGDVVVCAPVVAGEAEAQARQLQDHWAHMLVHGTLHLLGFDHGNDREAAEMEALETRILTAGGVTDPYSGE